jgi:hypothetical protein
MLQVNAVCAIPVPKFAIHESNLGVHRTVECGMVSYGVPYVPPTGLCSQKVVRILLITPLTPYGSASASGPNIVCGREGGAARAAELNSTAAYAIPVPTTTPETPVN